MIEKRIFWLKISGSGVKPKKVIKASLLADYLRNFNQLTQHVVKFRKLTIGEIKPDYFQLYLTNIDEGSYDAALEFRPPDYRIPFGANDPFQSAGDAITTIFDNIHSPTDQNYFIKEYPVIEDRVTIYRDLDELCPPKSNEFSIRISEKDQPKNILLETSLTEKSKGIIKIWIENAIEQLRTPQLIGQFNGFKTSETGSSLFVKLINGEDVKCDYREEDFQKIIDELKSHMLVRLNGNYKKIPGVRTEAKVEDLIKIEKIEMPFSLTFKKVGEIILTKPLVMETEFEDGDYILRNKDFSLLVWGKSESEFLGQLESCLNDLKTEILEADDESLTYDAQELKKRLKELFEFQNLEEK